MTVLNRQGILAARDKKTITLPVPEWGEGAQVLLGSPGALDVAEYLDWLAGLGRDPDPEPPEEAEPTETPADFTCDAPDPEAAAEVEPETEAVEGQPKARLYTQPEFIEAKLRWIALCLLDPETFEPAFTLADIRALGRKDPAVIKRINEACDTLNLEASDAVEDEEKNSGGTHASVSGGD